MTNVFVPKLYVFTKEYNPKLADFFGEENLKVIDLTTLDRLDNTNSNADVYPDKQSDFSGWQL